MNILTLESICDAMATAIVTERGEALGIVVASQDGLQQPWEQSARKMHFFL
jgi:hypothetical protein